MKILDTIRAARQRRLSGGPGLGWLFLNAILTKAARLCLAPISVKTGNDPYHVLFRDFIASVNGLERPRLMEIGSRARSGNIYVQGFAEHVSYVGMDIVPGPNVDVVGDAHALSSSFEAESFDAGDCVDGGVAPACTRGNGGPSAPAPHAASIQAAAAAIRN